MVIKVKKRPKWFYWPFTYEEYLEKQEPSNILNRIKIIIFLFSCLAFYLYSNDAESHVILAVIVGAILGILYALYYYNQAKSGKIIYED
ncbi:hypothetical protein HOD20_03880 [archaeon]|nr:hypothetical protein [archaeon]MBT4351642.1 hypothetical protein [archaeon]MBT4647377.1 hypothetical protein [archaeon]MBT6821380.1 hypothetical protein [archaeon]MBT7392833.1 hypothetical protein [archaeon]